MYMGLVLMFPVEILVRLVGMFQGRVVVLMDMFCYQMLNLLLPTAFSVMGHMDMLMSMDYFFVSMTLELSSRHSEASSYGLFILSMGSAGRSSELRPSGIWRSAARPGVIFKRLAFLDSILGKIMLKTPFS